MADEIDISRQLEESIRQSRKLQQDSNSELNKSINLLSKINDLRDASIAKVKALNRETINTKDIQRELQKAKEKDILTRNKISDLEKSMSDQEKQNSISYINNIAQRKKIEGDIQRARLKNDQAAVRSLGQQLTAVDNQILQQETALNIDERRYAATIEANKIAQENVQLLQEELDVEKEINKSIGFSGKTLGLFANKLGLGTKFYGEMVEKARDLNEEGKKLTFGDKLSALGKAGASGLKEALTDPLTAIPIAGAAIGGLVKGFMKIVELGLEAQDRTTKFGRAVGLSKNEAQGVVNNFQRISLNSNSALVTIERLVESQKELTDQLEVNNILSDEILETNVKLKELAGLDAQTRAEIAKSSTITGKSSESITKSVLAQVQGLKNATGISFNYQKILKEASNLGGYLGLSFAKYPAQLTKSLVTVKAMGMELKQLDSIADSFLDFESSISKEFEAQLLTGKEINLTKAREAFLNNDLATAAGEITRQVGSAQDFLKLNRIQAESLASAFGMSRDQMGEMLKQQELLSKLGAKDTDNSQKQLQLGLQKYKTQKALSEAVGEEAYQSLVNASAQEKIAGFMDKIKEAISNFIANSPLMPLIDKAIDYLSKPSNIKGIVTTIQGVFATMFDIFGKIAGGVMKVLDFLPGIDIPDELIDLAFSGGDSIRAMNLAGSVPTSVEPGSAKKDVGGSKNTNDNQYGGNKLAKPQTVVIQNKVTAVMDQKQLNNADQSVAISMDAQT